MDMTASNFRETVIVPVLRDMDMWSKSAETLLLMTACHESGGFRTEVQYEGGPARSYYQIEPATLMDLYVNFLRYRPKLLKRLEGFEPQGEQNLSEALLDDRYATAAARMIFYRVPEKLPAPDDFKNMARYCKSYWNTYLGKATQEEYLRDFFFHAMGLSMAEAEAQSLI